MKSLKTLITESVNGRVSGLDINVLNLREVEEFLKSVVKRHESDNDGSIIMVDKMADEVQSQGGYDMQETLSAKEYQDVVQIARNTMTNPDTALYTLVQFIVNNYEIEDIYNMDGYEDQYAAWKKCKRSNTSYMCSGEDHVMVYYYKGKKSGKSDALARLIKQYGENMDPDWFDYVPQ